MKKIYTGTLILVMAFILSGIVFAESDHNFEGVQEIIDNETSCAQLSDDQLERMGDYYMEQIHPGKAHKLMDNMMGGDGSEELRNAHIFMAKRLYCGENDGTGMMGMMSGSGMYGQTMFGNDKSENAGVSNTGMGMLNYGMSGFGIAGIWLTKILVWAFLLLGIGTFVKYLIKNK